MQKKAIRIVYGSKYNSHTEPLFKELKILPLDAFINILIYNFNNIKFNYDLINHLFSNNENEEGEEFHIFLFFARLVWLCPCLNF